jgi:hypothetical protein
MGVELLLLYLALMLVVGPGIMIYGVFIIVRRRVRLSRGKVLDGGAAVIAGTSTMIAGFAFTYFLWCMVKFFRH